MFIEVVVLDKHNDLLYNDSYMAGKSEAVFVKDGICVVTSSIDESKNIVKNCNKDSNGNFVPSKEEILCIKLMRGSEALIDDYGEDSMQPLCKYFK